MVMSKKLTLKFNQSNFSDFLNKFSDLTSIDDVVKLKIDKDEILKIIRMGKQQKPQGKHNRGQGGMM